MTSLAQAGATVVDYHNAIDWLSANPVHEARAFDEFYPGSNAAGPWICLSGSLPPPIAISGGTLTPRSYTSGGAAHCTIVDAWTGYQVSDGMIPNGGRFELEFSPEIFSFFTYFASLAIGSRGSMELYDSSNTLVTTIYSAVSANNGQSIGLGFNANVAIKKIVFRSEEVGDLTVVGTLNFLFAGQTSLGTVNIPGYNGPPPTPEDVKLDFAVSYVSTLPGTVHVPADYATIQAAIDAAIAGSEILVAPGTYNEAINFHGKALELRSSDGRDVTIIDATGLGDVSVISCETGESAATVIDGFTITGGPGRNNGVEKHGGGIWLDQAHPTVLNCIFQGNGTRPAGQGGAIRNFQSSPTFTNCIFRNNVAGNGGVFLGWGGHTCHPVFTDCVFENNLATYGAAFFNTSGAHVEARNCLFIGHIGAFRGVIHENESSSLFVDCTFVGNSVFNSGGALHFAQKHFDEFAYPPPRYVNCRFFDNKSTAAGGAVSSLNNAEAHFTNCVFAGNSSGLNGGAVAVTGTGQFTFSNCSFTGNRSSGPGGGGAIYSDASSTTTLNNCIVWGNAPDEISPLSGPVSYSNVRGGFAGTGNIDTPPLFADPDGPDNIPGTADDNYALFVNSLCIDAASNSLLPADVADLDGDLNTAEQIPFDIFGNARRVDDAYTADTGAGTTPIADIGAAEFVPMQLGVPGFRLWTDMGGGSFSDPGNWLPEPPTFADDLVFAHDAAYTVSFSGRASANRLFVTAGDLTLDLNGETLTVGHTAEESAIIGPFEAASNVTLTITDGTLEVDSMRVLETGGGTIILDATGHVIAPNTLHLNRGTLKGAGAVTGILRNAGKIEPGLGTSPACGIIAVSGNYEQPSGTFLVDLNGARTAGIDYDQLAVTNTATLGGTLQVQLAPGFFPQSNDQFEILTAGSIVGQFDIVFASGLPPGQLLTIDYGDTRGATGGGQGAERSSAVNLITLDYTGSLDFDNPSDSSLDDEAADALLADFNNDSFLDIAVALPALNSVAILLNNGGNGQAFTQQPLVPVGPGPVSITAAALDANASIDLAVANGAGNSVTVLLNNGSGAFITSQTITLTQPPTAIVAAPLTGTSNNDLAVATIGDGIDEPHKVIIFANNGSGAFNTNEPPEYELPGVPADMTAVDIDGNNAIDLVVVLSSTNEIIIFFNDGLPFARALSSPVRFTVGNYPSFVSPEDIDNDKDLDLVVGNAGGNSVSVLLNNGVGSFSGGAIPMQGTPLHATMADIDNDGDPELIVIVHDEVLQQRVVQLFRNDFNAQTGQVIFASGDGLDLSADATAILSGDVNNNGELDLVTINSPSSLREFPSQGQSPPRGLLNSVSMLPNKIDFSSCPADVVPSGGDGHVTIADITFVLSAYGLPCNNCPQDIAPFPDGDNQVTIADINAVLSAFGPCP